MPDEGPARAFSEVETDDPIPIHRALTRLVRKRAKKLAALVPEVLGAGDARAVHDARVWSRRLQQAMAALFPKPRSGKVRRLRRETRRIRRVLGEWRNCDVELELVERQQRRSRSEAKRRAWTFVRDHLLKKRDAEMTRARKKLRRHDVGRSVSLAHGLLDHPVEGGPEALMQRLRASVARAVVKWQAALARARDTRAAGDLHALRIATKGLRYRTELLRDVGQKRVKGQLERLEDLQEALGAWHDRQLLDEAVAEAMAHAAIQPDELPTARALLAALEADRGRQARDVERILRLATEHAGRDEMIQWNAPHSPRTPSSPLGPEVSAGGEGRKDEVTS